MTPNPLISNKTRTEKPLRPGNDTRQNSSKLVKIIVKTRHLAQIRRISGPNPTCFMPSRRHVVRNQHHPPPPPRPPKLLCRIYILTRGMPRVLLPAVGGSVGPSTQPKATTFADAVRSQSLPRGPQREAKPPNRQTKWSGRR